MRGSFAGVMALLLVSCSGGGGDKQAESGGGNEATAADTGGAGLAGANVAMQPGEWEITTQILSMDIPNMPQGVQSSIPAATTIRNCVTPEKASRPSADFLSGKGENSGCVVDNMSTAGGRIDGTIRCESQGTTTRVTMNGQMTPTSMEITQRIEANAQGMNMNMEGRVTGRRVGECRAG